MIRACAIATVFATLSGYANALEPPPISPEELLCGEDAVIVAHVIDARSHDCGKPIDGCYFHYVGVTAQIDEVVQPSKGNLLVGNEIRVGLQVSKGLTLFGDKPNNPGIINFPDADKVSDSLAKSELVGKRLLLAVTPVGRSMFLNDSAEKFPSEVGEPYFAWAYTPDREDWMRSTWASSYCAGVRMHTEMNREKMHRTGE